MPPVREILKEYFESWKSDYGFKTFVSAGVSSALNLAFIVFNAFMGLRYGSIWHGSVAIYYAILMVIRLMIVMYQKKSINMTEYDAERKRHLVVLVSHILLFGMDLSLFVPILAMLRGDRVYQWGLVPAIASAVYTTYRIVISIRSFVKARRHDDAMVKVLRAVQLIDTLFAILVLQNTLIVVNDGGVSGDMFNLSVITSCAISVGIIMISVFSFVTARKST